MQSIKLPMNLEKLFRPSSNTMAKLLALFLTSCANQVPIKNSRWFADVGSQGAIWADTLTTDQGSVAQPQWDDMRFGMLCTEASTYADWKAVIEKLCSVSNVCTYEIKTQLQLIFKNMDFLNKGVADTRRK